MIKFIYFDVGGVVIKDFSKTNKWDEFMEGLGINSSDFERFVEYWKSLEVSVREDMESIVPLINKEFGVSLSTNYDLLSDFVDRFEKNESIWTVIDKARNKYIIGLLTNIYPGMLDSIEDKGLMPDVEWDVVIDSSVAKLLKPQKEIYELAQQKAGVEANEILFVENSKSHIEAAKKLGWQTYLYDSSDYKMASTRLDKVI